MSKIIDTENITRVAHFHLPHDFYHLAHVLILIVSLVEKITRQSKMAKYWKLKDKQTNQQKTGKKDIEASSTVKTTEQYLPTYV